MNPRCSLLLAACVYLSLFARTTARAQFQANLFTPPESERAALAAGRDHLRLSIDEARKAVAKSGQPDLRVADAQIYLEAVDRCLAQALFFSRSNFDQAKLCLEEGEQRAADLQAGRRPWMRKTGVVVLGYRSKVDGSAQPYQVYVPADYDFDHSTPQRLDLFLHGRGGNLNEIAFIRSTGWVRGNFGRTAPAFLAMQPYGRGNNGWRYAGETDVYEALADCRSRYTVDANRTTLRGFSMGGHGVFHIGLHNPGEWAVISPGAGFVDTKHYLDLTSPMPEWQNDLLHLYDAVDVAANARAVPMISYVGELDPKLPQYRLMADALRREGAPFEVIIAAKTEHRYEPASLQSILDRMAAHTRDPASTVDFVTYTLRYPACKWITLLGLERHWHRSEVHGRISGDTVTLTTRNVSSLTLTLPDPLGRELARIDIDGAELSARPASRSSTVTLVKIRGMWEIGEIRGLHKRPGLQGPIDDALFDTVTAVAGTGRAWNESAEQWSLLELQRFRDCWGRYFRGTLPESTDRTLTESQKRGNVYLFGDPGSNAVLRRILPKLPLRWTKESITLKGRSFSATDHLPLLIFPNPEDPQHYVVINSGMTFSRADQEGSNGLQYPHLPDFAVIRIDPTHFTDDRKLDTELAGFFDESWR